MKTVPVYPRPRPTRRRCPFQIGLAGAAALLAAALSPGSARAELRPDQIALVVNSNVPEGAKLAEFYAQRRHIPPERTIALDLPAGDDLAYADYDQKIAPAVRKFLVDHDLQRKVTCLVTFYGVPLRIDGRVGTEAEKQELKSVQDDFKASMGQTKNAVWSLEDEAKRLDPSFKPPSASDELRVLPIRADAAVQACLKALARQGRDAKPADAATAVKFVEALAGPLETTQLMARPDYASVVPNRPTTQSLADAQSQAKQDIATLTLAPGHVADAADRANARRIIAADFGLFRYDALLQEQQLTLDASESESAFDSELALALWPAGYPRHRWIDNPINFRRQAMLHGLKTPPVLMVMRLDAPTPALVHNLIDTGIQVEEKGLTGQVVLDARGKPPSDPYGVYDQTIRNLANLLKDHTDLKVTLNDVEPLIPPHSEQGVALYCGWYSLRKYVPCCAFNPGAVGFHVASFELVDLHNPGETGWVHGLMNDGVVATLGPVAEPYLHSFPRADEFFPLLLTGKLTLAEVYWRTTPLVSWMQDCIGDPLYMPYKVNAPLKVDDLPPVLRGALADAPPAQ